MMAMKMNERASNAKTPQAAIASAAQLVLDATNHLRDADRALRDSHQTGVDAWLKAAADRLQKAVHDLDHADRQLGATASHGSAA
jgi:hypothetical protein